MTRRRCSLCDEALERLEVPARLLRVAIDSVDVDGDPQLVATFGRRVPVVLVEDAVLAEGRISRAEAWRAAWTARRR